MKQLDEGVIKFKFTLKKSAPLKEPEYIELEKWRAILYRMTLIGEYKLEKVGYGNISKRIQEKSDEFIITGTQTGHLPHLNGAQYTKVNKCNLDKMSVEAAGPIAPSSESLTHYAIYHKIAHIQFIFHVHHTELWQYMIDKKMDSTPADIGYGTKEMAESAEKIIGNKRHGIFVMKGHQDGIISYGETAEEAGRVILDTLKKIRQNPD
jgi:ribulose-5-phosphate 4-epimerase/fuculose-1-phosphate aldolase